MNVINRTKYNMKRNCFYKKPILGFMIPWIPSEIDIEIDLEWRKLKAKNIKKAKIYGSEFNNKSIGNKVRY